MRAPRPLFALAAGAALLALLAGTAALLGPRAGRQAALGTALGVALGAASTLAGFARALRKGEGGSERLLRIFGIGFLVKLFLLASGTFLGRSAGYDPAAYAIAFAAGFALVAAGGIADVHRRRLPGARGGAGR